MHIIRSESLTQSLGSDYMHDSRRDSLRDSFFFTRGVLKIERRRVCSAQTVCTFNEEVKIHPSLRFPVFRLRFAIPAASYHH